MSSRNDILRAIRNQSLPATELPPLDGPWITYADRRQQFLETLTSVGGTGIVVKDRAEADRTVRELPVWRSATKTCSLVESIGDSTFDLAAVDDPHELADVDVAILPGEFGIAENAAVRVTDRDLRHRVLYFLVQHLVLVLSASEIVETLHDAYRRIADDAAARGHTAFDEPGFSAFISGPSKTADIEQSLVIGAHGARSLTILLVERL